MSEKSLWKLIWFLFKLWILYMIGSAILELFLEGLLGFSGVWISQAVMLILCASALYEHLRHPKQAKQKKPAMPQPDPQKKQTRTQSSNPAKSSPSQSNFFAADQALLAQQKERMALKEEYLREMVAEQFGAGSLTARKYLSVFQDVYNDFNKNCQEIAQRIRIFDVAGYERLQKEHLHYSAQAAPYRKSLAWIDTHLQENENVLQKTDELLNQLQELGSGPDDDNSLEPLNNLIEQTRIYSSGSAYSNSYSDSSLNGSDDMFLDLGKREKVEQK